MECKHLYEKVKESNFLETLFYHWDECKFLAVKEYGEMPLEDEDRLYKRTKLNKMMTKILNDCGKWNIVKCQIYAYGENEHKAQARRLSKPVSIAQTDRRAGLRPDQAGKRIPPVPSAQHRQGQSRMGHDLHRPQPPADIR